MARHPRWVRKFLSEPDLDDIVHAIRRAEAETSAEVRVHLARRCPGDALASAIQVFDRLGMHRTAERNGVLIYVAMGDRKLALVGDQGIHSRVGDVYWQRLVGDVLRHFREEHHRDGFVHAIGELGALLSRHFPRRPSDENELSDRVSVE